MFAEEMKRAIWIISFLGAAALIVGLLIAKVGFSRDAEILAALQQGKIEDARMLMQGRHDLKMILADLPQDQKSLQAALDVQFEYAYVAEEDTNYAYPEDLSAIQTLLDAGAQPKFRHLLAAAQQGKMKTVSFFMDRGVPVQESGSNVTPLSDVAYYGDAGLLRRMIAAGADVNFSRSADGWTPLLGGAWSGQEECVKVLLDSGADINALYTVWGGNRQPVWKVIKDRTFHLAPGDSRLQVWQLVAAHKTNSEQVGADQPATAPESKPEGNLKPQTKSEMRPR